MDALSQADTSFAPFKEILLQACGFHFESERERSLATRIGQRMAERKIESMEAYLSLLQKDQQELQQLVEALTVNETYFFREPEQLHLMAGTLAPEILRRRTQEPLRVVSAGCSTGEEPYSIAMILREHLGAGSEKLFSVIGVDIDSEVIATARTGIYERNSFRAMDSTLRDRYFYPCGPNQYQLGEIKQQVTLAVANLLAKPYPPVLHQPDIIFYRNVSIYFPSRIQEAIFRQLAALLREDGYLFVGAAETMHHNLGVLKLIERNGLFFYHKPPARSSACCPRERRSLIRQGPAGGIPAFFRKPPLAVKGAERLFRTIPTESSRGPTPRVRPLQKIDVQDLIAQAHSLAQNSSFDAALQLLDQIVIDNPALIEALVLKGSILMSTARLEEAKALCRTALELQPLCSEAILILGLIALQDGEEEEARQRLRQTIYLQQASWLAHFSLAEMNFRQADQHRARHGYETALRILQQETTAERDRALFPLAYNAGEFMAICRHKLSLL